MLRLDTLAPLYTIKKSGKSMRQLSCVGTNHIEWQEVPEPLITLDTDALVRPLAVARCELDPLLVAGANAESAPFALGHEGVGEIVALGDSVKGLKIGQRVVIAFQLSCGFCPSCNRGHSAICDSFPLLSDYGMQPLSGHEYGGFISDLIKVPFAQAMLHPIPSGFDPVALASVSDNVLDGYRTVAPHLTQRPLDNILIVSHGTPSISLYALQTALALGVEQVDFATDDNEVLSLAESLGARPIKTDFKKRQNRYPLVVDCGIRKAGLLYAIHSTQAEGICQSASYYLGEDIALPLGRLYTLGIKFFIGRAHSASLLPEVMPLIESGKLKPQKVTTKIIEWEDAPDAFMDKAIKLVVKR